MLLAGLGVPFMVLLAFTQRVRSAEAPAQCAGLEVLDQSLWQHYLGWLKGFSAGLDGTTWSCGSLRLLLNKVGDSLVLMGAALVLAMVAAVVWIWLGHRENAPDSFGVGLVSLMPTILLASLLTVAVNLGVIAVWGFFPDFQRTDWLFPLARVPGMRWSAAVLVLAVSGGGFWELKNGLAADHRALMGREFMLAATANGLSLRGKLLRNLAPSFLVRAVGRVPILLGEVIVVEYVFSLNGIGWSIRGLTEKADVPALMTIGLVFALLFQVVRTGMVFLTETTSSPEEA